MKFVEKTRPFKMATAIGFFCVLTLSVASQPVFSAYEQDKPATADAKPVQPPIEQPAPPKRDAAFEAWLDAVRAEARERGISQATLDTALADVTPIVRVIQRDRNQPEVKQTYARYLKARVSDWRKSRGAIALNENADSLQAAAGKYGVQPRFIAAIWGVETNYGTVPLTYSVFDADRKGVV